MTVADAIQHPTATVVLLAEITAGLWARAWVADGTYTTTYKVATAFTDRAGKTQRHTITSVTVDGTAATERASAAALDAAADGWHHDGDYLWIKPPSGTTAHGNTWVATCKFYHASHAKVLNSIFWEPRLESAPAISQRIEAVFGDLSQIGGGDLALTNVDGFFADLSDLLWDTGTVTLKLGVDLPGGDMAWADYETLATWRIEAWEDDGDRFRLTLQEPKARVKAKLPLSTFSRDDFPNIDDSQVGRPIPLAYGMHYGVEPVLVDPGSKTFKVAGHAIRSFDGVRIKKNRVELITRATSSLDWLLYSGTTRRYYIAGETVKTVTFKGTVLTEANDIDDVTSTASRWCYVENYVYVNPPSSADWSAGTVSVESEQESPAFITTNFASVDAANGEFTLGDDWAVGTEIAVDFRGKISGTDYLENAIDIIEDLLTVAGETNLDTASFTAARARLLIGTDENGSEVNILRPSLYITEAEDLVDIIGGVCELARAYVYSDSTGQYSVGVFEPEPSEGLATIEDMDILGMEKSWTAADQVTSIVARYQIRPVDGYSQIETVTSSAFETLRDQPAAVAGEYELATAHENDAEYWAQAMLCLLGKPLAKHQLAVPWRYMTLAPGDQVIIESDEYNVSGVFEVLEKRLDLASKQVTLIVGNLRAFEDAPGFWVGNSDVLPTRFAALTGYSAGSLVWNSSWDPEIKAWARKNVGYWTDANGFAATADADSFATSIWT